ncbi:enoyl-CoA hydratase/isomerase family protein [Pseudonocardia kunmingensis]|uniref:2-(1,2-epoxy-1,2-dihydrophenyl)acetyl-CoA isomerase n=1 Tax=Pseudonocardia kunmingensis TaxID=630975 RepID=A0A543DRI0_9PSEU|nr:enoyl-CoA hydratase/isomerase family protein [Pseudonocardia kunmingensis]TQM11946.1 2-(1,2-epoxy-1,2-dihydrophenyl)acetyl-CoA isomerase [Pseudonocardia kunmingensis]
MREIRYEVTEGVATATIDRPEKRGAMTYAMLEEFTACVARAGADEQVRVLLVTGVPGSFCAGIDLADLAGRDPGDRGRADGDGGGGVPLLMGCPKPVVAAVDGMAVGMGAEFATQADLRVVSTRARFRWNFVHRGLVSDTGAGTWLLPRQIGVGPALRLLYTGEDLDAGQALALGFATEVVEPDELPAAAERLARTIATASPFALVRTKKLVLEGAGADLRAHVGATRAAMAECFASADHAEGVASFLERRPARFTGR